MTTIVLKAHFVIFIYFTCMALRLQLAATRCRRRPSKQCTYCHTSTTCLLLSSVLQRSQYGGPRKQKEQKYKVMLLSLAGFRLATGPLIDEKCATPLVIIRRAPKLKLRGVCRCAACSVRCPALACCARRCTFAFLCHALPCCLALVFAHMRCNDRPCAYS